MKTFKRYISLMIISALCLALFALPAQAAQNGMVRVLLTRLGKVSTLRFSPDCACVLSSGELKVNVPAGADITVRANGSNINVSYGKRSFDMTGSASFKRTLDGSKGFKFTEPKLENRFCGELILTAEGSILTPVLRISMEDYLYGVVGSEMSNSYPLEALKAQAVAARTYALKKMAANASRAYDLTDTTDTQAFKGYSPSQENVIRAVNATAGEALYAGNALANCYYSDSNGGQTESAKNAWGSALSYSVVKDDPYDLENGSAKKKTCLIRRDLAGLNGELAAALKRGMKEDLESWGMDAAPENITLRSINSVEAVDPKFPEPSRLYTMLRFGLSVAAPSKLSGKPVSADVTVDIPTYGSFETWYGLSINSAANETVTVEEGAAGFTVSFRRWGHGVGMSQRGAQTMASSAYSKSYRDILDFYYPGTKLQKLSLQDDALSSAVTENIPETAGENTSTISPYALPTLEPLTTAAPEPAEETTIVPSPQATPTPTAEPQPTADDSIQIIFLSDTPTPDATQVAPLFANIPTSDATQVAPLFANIPTPDATQVAPLFANIPTPGTSEKTSADDNTNMQATATEDYDADDDEDFLEAFGALGDDLVDFEDFNSDEFDMSIFDSDDDGDEDGWETDDWEDESDIFEDDEDEPKTTATQQPKATATQKPKATAEPVEDDDDVSDLFAGFAGMNESDFLGGADDVFTDDGKESKSEKKESKTEKKEESKSSNSGFDESEFVEMSEAKFTLEVPGFGDDVYVDKEPEYEGGEVKTPKSDVTAYVNVSAEGSLTLRSEASAASEATGYLSRGEAVRVLKYNDLWAYVQTQSGKKGFASRQYLTLDPVTDDTPEATVSTDDTVEETAWEGLRRSDANVTFRDAYARTTSNVNMRTDRSLEGEVLGTIPEGEIVHVRAYDDDWVYCDYKGHKGYVAKAYLKLVKK